MEELIKKHDVKILVHFTRCDNLKNIFRYGLLTRSYLIDNKIYSIFNDTNRFDGYKNAICASISFPNYKMFYRLRYENPSIKWAIIIINKKVLIDKECAFCIDNAASNSETSIPIQQKKNKEAFDRLFEEYPGQFSRETLGIAKNMTTNPQSEVLIFDNIELEYILGIIFENESDKEQYKKDIPKEIEFIVHDNLFKGRVDYEYWR